MKFVLDKEFNDSVINVKMLRAEDGDIDITLNGVVVLFFDNNTTGVWQKHLNDEDRDKLQNLGISIINNRIKIFD